MFCGELPNAGQPWDAASWHPVSIIISLIRLGQSPGSEHHLHKQSPIRMPLCCLWRWLNLSLEDAALQVPLENLHLCSSYHPPIYNNYCCSKDRGIRRTSGAVDTPSAPYCSPESEPQDHFSTVTWVSQTAQVKRVGLCQMQGLMVGKENDGTLQSCSRQTTLSCKRWCTEKEALPHSQGQQILLMTLLSCLSIGKACSSYISTILKRRTPVQSHLDVFFWWIQSFRVRFLMSLDDCLSSK